MSSIPHVVKFDDIRKNTCEFTQTLAQSDSGFRSAIRQGATIGEKYEWVKGYTLIDTEPKTEAMAYDVTHAAKELLDKDTLALMRAGFLERDLTLTGRGKDELIQMLWLEKKAELAKRATEVLKEEEKKA